MKTPLEIAEALLDAPRSDASDRARGTFAGVEIELRFVDRGAGSTRDPYTEVVVVGAAVRPDLVLHVIPQTARDAADVAAGHGTDVRLGDSAFDDAFLVEAGPEDVVRLLFRPKVRVGMMAVRPIGVHTTPDGLMVEKSGWIEDAELLRPLVALAAGIAGRVPEAFEAADRERLASRGYRDAPQHPLGEEQRRAEVEGVKQRKKARERLNFERGCMMALVIFALVIVADVIIHLVTR